MSRQCLVTGCAGFIGSHLSERLVRDGYHVTGIDCFTNYYPRSIKESNLAWLRTQPGFRFVETDLLRADLPALVAEKAWVFHQAAQAGVRAGALSRPRAGWGPFPMKPSIHTFFHLDRCRRNNAAYKILAIISAAPITAPK